MSWSDIRCRLDKLFQEAYLVDQNSTAANTESYDAIRDFLKKLFEIDGDAVVNHGGWYPPLTMDGWSNPNAKWFDQTPIVRAFRNVAPVEGEKLYYYYIKILIISNLKISFKLNMVIYLHLVAGNSKCNPLTWTSYDSGCCTEAEPCGVGEGDCDKDSHCLGLLSCGDNNCNGTGFTSAADCCYMNS